MKHIHFIGICGVGMSALAILWQKNGWKVTGSDSGFYPPVSTNLLKHGIYFYPGWHPEKMGRPDLVVVGNVAGSENPEVIHASENKILNVSYPELIAKSLIKQNSIVCAGTYGKTTATALISYILKHSDYKPAYMFGGIADCVGLSADDLGGEWSVIEGDEYKTSKNNLNAKFFSYKPTHLLLTDIKWDHADIYPTEKAYFEAFKKLIKIIPESGLVVYCADRPVVSKIVKNAKARIISYGKQKADYTYADTLQTKDGVKFTIKHKGEKFKIISPMVGEYMAENICGAFALCAEIGVDEKKIINSIKNFTGIKRRLEKRGATKNGAVVYDDIAHSPAKASSAIESLKKIYTGKVSAIFEPNTGNRQKESFSAYDGAFALADEVVVPRFTKTKTPNSADGKKISEIISKSHSNTKYFDNDEELVNYLKTTSSKNDAIVFMGSHGFRGMIEEVIK